MTMKNRLDQLVWVAARFIMGFMFFWAFLDKLFGLGFATTPEKAWLHGGSPTTGFLFHATGWFAPIFHALAGFWVVDVLFMTGLCLIGLSMLLGVGLRVAGVSGALLTFFMWLAEFPPVNNPIFDEHVLYMVVFLGLAFSITKPGQMFGLGQVWSGTSIVKKFPWLE